MAKKKTAKKTIKKKVVKKKTTKKVARKIAVKTTKKNTRALAATALILNALIFPLPGIGSLIGGKVKAGIWQIILGLLGGLLFSIWIGIPIWLVAWIWGIVTGINLIKEAQ